MAPLLATAGCCTVASICCLSRKPLDTVVHHQGLKLNRCLPASLGAVNTCKHVTQEEAYHLVEHPLTHQMGRCKSSHLLLHMPFKPIEQEEKRDCDGTSAGSESASIVFITLFLAVFSIEGEAVSVCKI